MKKDPINVNNDDIYHEALDAYHRKMTRVKIPDKILLFSLQELQKQSSRKMG